MRLSIRRTERGAGLPTASFIIICLAGGSESGQTEQTPSIFLLLTASLFFLLIFCHFHPLLLIVCMILPSPSRSLHLIYFFCPVRILFHLVFLCSVARSLSLPPVTDALPSSFPHRLYTVFYFCFPFCCSCSIYYFSFYFHINLRCSILFILFLSCSIYVFSMPHLHWFGAFRSPFLRCNFPLLFSIFLATIFL